MYVKFFSNKKGGSSAAIKYLLDHREKEGTARVLKGDPKLTSQIINSIQRKQKATVGVLSFEEKDPLTEEQKYEIMEDFEKTLLPGLSKDQYNILWVEHTDKGRLELNFVIPKIELTTQKALQPYYHLRDFARIDMLEDISNIKYGLSSKKDPAKARTLRGSYKEINLIKDYKKLDKTLFELVAQGQIHNREQLIETLKNARIKVTRVGKDYISVKLPESKKARRLKGGIYCEQFTSLESLERIGEETERRAIEFSRRDTSRELEQIVKRLEKYNDQKARENEQKFKKREQNHFEEHRQRTRAVENEQTKKLHCNSHNKLSDRLDSRSNAHENTFGGEIDDSTRAAFERRDQERERILKEVRNSVVLESSRVHRHIEQDSKPIYEQAQRVMSRRRKRRRVRKRLREAIRGFRERYFELKDKLVENFENITRRIKARKKAEKIQNQNQNQNQGIRFPFP